MSELVAIAREALEVDGIASAVIFVPRPGAGGLDLAAAAGIDGPPLEGLAAAAQDPDHPVARAVTDAEPTFDVRPINPGGPALRSHLPLGGLGVLAVAHDPSLSREARSDLERLASAAAEVLRRG